MKYFDTCTKMPNNEGHLVKIIVATGFKKLPKVQQIAESGHSDILTLSLKRSQLNVNVGRWVGGPA